MAQKFHEGQWVKNGNQIGWINGVYNNYVAVKYLGATYTSNSNPEFLESAEDISPDSKEAAKSVLLDMALLTKDKVLFEYAVGKRSDYDSCIECKQQPAVYCDKSFCEDCFRDFLNE